MEFEDVDELAEELEGEDLVDDGPRCLGCGCSRSRACPGGCVWANANYCSRCV